MHHCYVRSFAAQRVIICKLVPRCPSFDTDFLAMNMIKNVVLCAAALFIGASIQGCGCDEDKGKKCISDYATANAAAGGNKDKVCAASDSFGKCIDDASCCDYENNGKMKDVVGAAVAVCTTAGGSASNPC